jgi:penicillin amidase
MVASDPHIAFEAVSCWYEVHLSGGSFETAGMAYAGIPAVLFGRNRRVAWGITNNICSIRDLYQERTDPAHPGAFLFDGRWEPERRLDEVIEVRGAEPVRKTIRFSRNGPIVDEVLPAPARGTGPVALKWLGAHQWGWLTSVLGMDRAGSAEEFREAVRPWYSPTFTLVYADVDGHIGCQLTGRIPIRRVAERGYRPGWDPEHQWEGLIPFDAMPHAADPERGWIASANNRPVPDDFPYPLSGTWSDDLRARRIRQLIEATPRLGFDEVVAMHQDCLSLRGLACVPQLVQVLESSPDPRIRTAVEHLRSWDGRVDVDRVGAALFNVFFQHWTQAVADERFAGETAVLLAGGLGGLAAALLAEDAAGWFAAGRREPAIRAAFAAALDDLAHRLGPEMSSWTWGRLHPMPLRHVLSNRGELARLLDHGGIAVRGDLSTVCNTGMGPQFEAKTGAGYRLIADLSVEPPGLWAVDGQGQSGQPGSPHYSDQLEDWLNARYHWIPLGPEGGARAATRTTVLLPEGAHPGGNS